MDCVPEDLIEEARDVCERLTLAGFPASFVFVDDFGNAYRVTGCQNVNQVYSRVPGRVVAH